MRPFFFLLAVFPFIELLLLIKLGETIGFGPTVLFMAASAALGLFISRIHGASVLQQIRGQLRSGQLPAEAMVDALLIFIGGMLLVLPGVLTDILGLILLFPPSRFLFKRWLRTRFDRMIQKPGPQGASGFEYRLFVE